MFARIFNHKLLCFNTVAACVVAVGLYHHSHNPADHTSLFVQPSNHEIASEMNRCMSNEGFGEWRITTAFPTLSSYCRVFGDLREAEESRKAQIKQRGY